MALSNALYQAGAQGLPIGSRVPWFNPTANGPGMLGPALDAARQSTLANLPTFPQANLLPPTRNIAGAGPFARVLGGGQPLIPRANVGSIPMGAGANTGAAALPYARGGLMGGARGLLSSATGALGGGGGAGGAGLRGALSGVSGRALLGRAGAGGFAGMIGSNVIDRFNPGGQNSNIEQGLQGAAMGAGIGAGIGSVVPVIGTATGAIAGGIIGGGLGIAGNVFGWGGDDKEAVAPHDQLNQWLGAVNISPDAARNIREQFEMEMMFAEDAEDKEAAQAQALANAQMGIQQYWATEQEQSRQAERAMAFQMAAQQYMAPQLSRMRDTQNALSTYMESMAPDLPPEFQPIARLMASQGRAATDRTISAYANQVSMMQQTNALQQFYSDTQNMAAQQMSANIAQGVGGGGSGDLLAALTQQQLG